MGIQKLAYHLSCSKNLCLNYLNNMNAKSILTTRTTRAFTGYENFQETRWMKYLLGKLVSTCRSTYSSMETISARHP